MSVWINNNKFTMSVSVALDHATEIGNRKSASATNHILLSTA